MKVFPYTYDSTLTLIKTEDELLKFTDETELVEAESIDIPDDLFKEYQDAYESMYQIGKKIERLMDKPKKISFISYKISVIYRNPFLFDKIGNYALSYDGIYNLLCMWDNESDIDEKIEIFKEIKKLIKDIENE